MISISTSQVRTSASRAWMSRHSDSVRANSPAGSNSCNRASTRSALGCPTRAITAMFSTACPSHPVGSSASAKRSAIIRSSGRVKASSIWSTTWAIRLGLAEATAATASKASPPRAMKARGGV